jgi:hypothetical protein
MKGHKFQELQSTPGFIRYICCRPIIQYCVKGFLRKVKSRDRGMSFQSKSTGIQLGDKTGKELSFTFGPTARPSHSSNVIGDEIALKEFGFIGDRQGRTGKCAHSPLCEAQSQAHIPGPMITLQKVDPHT